MIAQHAARRSRDLEFAAFTALARVMIDSKNFLQAQATIAQAARALSISDDVALQIIQRCLDFKPMSCAAEMTRDFDVLDQKMTSIPMLQSIEDDTSQFTPTQQPCPMEISQQLFNDLIGPDNGWPRFIHLLENGGTQQEFEDIRETLLRAATKLRQQITIE